MLATAQTFAATDSTRATGNVMRVRVEIEDCLSTGAWERSRNGQRYWWCRRLPYGGFIPLDHGELSWWQEWLGFFGIVPPNFDLHWADAPLRVTLELLPGSYCFGCGPSPPEGVRKVIDVAETGVSWRS